MNQLVTFDQFESSKLNGSEPIKQGNDAISYHDIKLHYNYGTPAEPIISDLFFELPPITAGGIQFSEKDAKGKNGPYKKQAYSMMLRFDLSNMETRAELQKALDKVDEVHSKACHLLASCKGKVKMFDFDPSRPGEIFKSPVYYPRDEVTGEKVKGKNPSMWVKLRNYKTNRTLFTDLKGNIVDWKLLTDVDVTLVPLLHFEKIYIGTKVSIQVHLASAIILKIVAAGTQSRQVTTMDRLKEKYGVGLADTLESELAELRMARQDVLASTSVQKEFGSTDYGTMHSVVPSQTSSAAAPPQQTEQASLQDFLSAAPPMTTTLKIGTPLKLN